MRKNEEFRHMGKKDNDDDSGLDPETLNKLAHPPKQDTAARQAEALRQAEEAQAELDRKWLK